MVGQNRKDPKTGLNKQQEMFCQLRASGLTATQSAKGAGYSASRAASQGCILAKDPKIINRIEELAAEAATATAAIAAPKLAQNLIGYEIKLPGIRDVALARSHIIEMLLRNIDEAREAEQYGVVRASIVDMAKIAGIYVESRSQDIRFKLNAGEDLSTMSDAELSQLQAMLTKLQGETIEVLPELETKAIEAPAAAAEPEADGEEVCASAF